MCWVESQKKEKEEKDTLSPAALKASPVAALCSGENFAGTAITALFTLEREERRGKRRRGRREEGRGGEGRRRGDTWLGRGGVGWSGVESGVEGGGVEGGWDGGWGGWGWRG